MSRDDGHRIQDILDAAKKVELLVSEGRKAYDESLSIGPAIERFLEIIGEASNVLTDETRAQFPTVDWAQIRGLRIMLAHQYHRVDIEIVWKTATVSVPALTTALQAGTTTN